MKIKGNKITITYGDSMPINFKLIADEVSVITTFTEEDKIYWVVQEKNGCCDIIKKEITGIDGTIFSVFVSKDESKKLCPGRYEHGVYLENGDSRITLLKPVDLIVERGV